MSKKILFAISTVEMSVATNPVMWHNILKEQNPMRNCG
jgi:hypothetical protein